MIAVRLAKFADVSKVADLHVIAFKGFLLTDFGHRFLRLLYSAFIGSREATLLVACDSTDVIKHERADGVLKGFVAGTLSPVAFFRQMRRQKGLLLAVASLPGLLRHPRRVFGRLIAATRYQGDATVGTDGLALLSSLAVVPEYTGRGIGSQLLREFIAAVQARGAKGVYLLTDEAENGAVRTFYETNGFEAQSRLSRANGRVMLMYVRKFPT
jgi:ribosomal protein S18 acetylase RimI-like enzyme